MTASGDEENAIELANYSNDEEQESRSDDSTLSFRTILIRNAKGNNSI